MLSDETKKDIHFKKFDDIYIMDYSKTNEI
jgi:hypothetical protein